MMSLKLFCKRIPDVKMLLVREMHKNKSYYDALGLTPKASNADIKKAYYKMSMMFHPDKEAGNPDKFREITAAYEVLGNTKLRKLYDQGHLSPGAMKSATAQEAAEKAAKKQEEDRRAAEAAKRNHHRQEQFYEQPRSPNFDEASKTYTGRTERYDYDAWTKGHYSETFRKQTEDREGAGRMEEDLTEKKGIIFVVSVVLLAIAASAYAKRIHTMHDRPLIRTNFKDN